MSPNPVLEELSPLATESARPCNDYHEDDGERVLRSPHSPADFFFVDRVGGDNRRKESCTAVGETAISLSEVWARCHTHGSVIIEDCARTPEP